MKAILIVGLMAIAAAAMAIAAQNPLDAARDLYASAAYEEALSALSRLSEGGAGSPDIAKEVDEYRAFCLYALGRTDEAESLAEAIIRREPLSDLSAADASPRLEAMFASVRKRVLPGLIRDQYRAVRGLLDDKQYAAAEPRLAEVRRLLTTAETIGAWDDGLADLRVLVDGFLALSRAHTVNGTPASGSSAQAAATLPPASSGPPEATPAFANSAASEPRLYSADDADVTPPTAISQPTPSVPVALRTLLRTQPRPMILFLTIDEAGSVQKAEVRASINTSYDELLVRAAATWRYAPATRNGVPVRYLTAVVVDIR
jgi:tetratricopeptide (TPR) repeat protein